MGMDFDQKEFDREIKIELKKVSKALKESARGTADKIMRLLAVYSPIWSGSYILSHRIGINKQNDRGPVIRNKGIPGIPPRVNLSKVMAYRNIVKKRVKVKVKIKSMPDNGKLIVYNGSRHAQDVEFLPDKYVTGKISEPYLPYHKAKQQAESNVPAIIQTSEAKHGVK
jgi:hypothetical protein